MQTCFQAQRMFTNMSHIYGKKEQISASSFWKDGEPAKDKPQTKCSHVAEKLTENLESFLCKLKFLLISKGGGKQQQQRLQGRHV
jgi:hypothetical protein